MTISTIAPRWLAVVELAIRPTPFPELEENRDCVVPRESGAMDESERDGEASPELSAVVVLEK